MKACRCASPTLVPRLLLLVLGWSGRGLGQDQCEEMVTKEGGWELASGVGQGVQAWGLGACQRLCLYWNSCQACSFHPATRLCLLSPHPPSPRPHPQGDQDTIVSVLRTRACQHGDISPCNPNPCDYREICLPTQQDSSYVCLLAPELIGIPTAASSWRTSEMTTTTAGDIASATATPADDRAAPLAAETFSADSSVESPTASPSHADSTSVSLTIASSDMESTAAMLPAKPSNTERTVASLTAEPSNMGLTPKLLTGMFSNIMDSTDTSSTTPPSNTYSTVMSSTAASSNMDSVVASLTAVPFVSPTALSSNAVASLKVETSNKDSTATSPRDEPSGTGSHGETGNKAPDGTDINHSRDGEISANLVHQTETSPETTTPKESTCQYGSSRNSTNLDVKTMDQSMTFNDANAACCKEGMRIITADTREKMSWIQANLQGFKDSEFLWLNMLKDDSGWVWQHTQSAPTDNFWAPYQPNAQGDEQSCAVLSVQDNFQWHDASCTGVYRVACE